MRLCTALALLSACGPGEHPPPPDAPDLPDLPYVHVDAFDRAAEFVVAARIWSGLGFDAGDAPSGLPECPRDWYLAPPNQRGDCEISIVARIEPVLVEKTGSDGFANRVSRDIFVDDSLWIQHGPIYRAHIMAHEFGHVLLNTSAHTPTGIMSSQATTFLSDDDRDVACQEIGVCL